MRRRLALVVGDTPGHVTPALAIAEAYRGAFPEVDVFFLAAENGPASQLVPASGYDLEHVPALPLARARFVERVAALARTGACIARARRLLSKRGTRLVIGSGGYASGGVLLAARSLRLATAIVEPNAEPGLANRLLKHAAERAYFTFPEAARSFPPERTAITGTPVRATLSSRAGATRRRPEAGTPVRILVTTGSRGGAFLATHVPALLGRLRDDGVDVEVLHQAGTLDLDVAERAYATVGVTASVVDRIDDMGNAYDWAHFAIARAGASTLAELAVAGIPALLVPLGDAAADHQAANARYAADSGAAVWTRESEWQVEPLADRLRGILLDTNTWQDMARSARMQARPDAAARIVDDCERMMKQRW